MVNVIARVKTGMLKKHNRRDRKLKQNNKGGLYEMNSISEEKSTSTGRQSTCSVGLTSNVTMSETVCQQKSKIERNV